MFRRNAKRKDEQRARDERAADQREIVRLNSQVERLEHALREVIAASDDAIIDLRGNENERAVPRVASRTGFAAAWNSLDSATAAEAGDAFFQLGAIDKRSRRWLLAPR